MKRKQQKMENDYVFFKLIVTKEDRKEQMKYWETVLKQTKKIRDEYDKAVEKKYRDSVINK